MFLKRIILIFLLSLNSSLYADESNDVLKFAMIDSKPYYYLEDNEYKGEAIKYISRICNKAGYSYAAYMYPVKRLLKYIETGEIDIAFIPEGLVNKEKTILANQRTSTLEIGLYYDKNKQPQIDLSDLNGKRIVVIKNYTYSGFLDKLKSLYPEIKTVIANDPSSTFKMLDYGRGDLVLAYRRITEASKIPIDNLNFQSLHKADIYLAISPKSKHKNLSMVIDRLNEANDHVVDNFRKQRE